MPSINETLGEQVANRRKLKGMSQDELATAIDVARGTIARIESGKGGASLSTIAALANALDCEETDLVYPGQMPAPIVVTPTPLEALAIIERALKAKPIPAAQPANLPADIQKMLAKLPAASHDTLRAVLKGALRGAGIDTDDNGERHSG